MNVDTNSNRGETSPAPIVLVVEDDAITRKAVGRKLHTAGYEVILVPTAGDALIVLQRMAVHVLVLDLHLADHDPFNGIHDGFTTLDWLRRQVGEFRFRLIIHTTQGEPHVIEKAESYGAFAFCIKRRDLNNLLECVNDAVKSFKAAA